MGGGPATFEDMGIPLGKSENDCVSFGFLFFLASHLRVCFSVTIFSPFCAFAAASACSSARHSTAFISLPCHTYVTVC
jgi:hypothetical protein